MPATCPGATLSISKIIRRHLLPLPLVLAVGVVVAAGLSARPAAAATTVSVVWNANVEPGVTGYRVSWGVKSGAYTSTIDAGNQTSVQFTEPDPTVPYYFIVQAYNRDGVFSAYSFEAASVPVVVVGPPVAQTGGASAITSTGATLNGTANPQGAATTGYFAYGPTVSYGSTTPLMNVAWGGAPVAIGNGNVTGLTCQTLYHFHAMASNSVGTASGTDATFTTAPCGTQTASPSGTRVPVFASITDASLAVWTIASGQQILKNGIQAANGSGTQILWFQNTIYVPGADGTWYKWMGSNWAVNGSTDPSGTATASPSGTSVPPAPSITDNSLAVWTIGSGQQILKNGVQAAGGLGSQILWSQNTIFVLGTGGNWYQWTGSTWANAVAPV